MDSDIPDDWFDDHDGQSRVLDPEKVSAELARLRAEIRTLNNFLDGIHSAASIALKREKPASPDLGPAGGTGKTAETSQAG